jgi:hypothetical protein
MIWSALLVPVGCVSASGIGTSRTPFRLAYGATPENLRGR